MNGRCPSPRAATRPPDRPARAGGRGGDHLGRRTHLRAYHGASRLRKVCAATARASPLPLLPLRVERHAALRRQLVGRRGTGWEVLRLPFGWCGPCAVRVAYSGRRGRFTGYSRRPSSISLGSNSARTSLLPHPLGHRGGPASPEFGPEVLTASRAALRRAAAPCGRPSTLYPRGPRHRRPLLTPLCGAHRATALRAGRPCLLGLRPPDRPRTEPVRRRARCG